MFSKFTDKDLAHLKGIAGARVFARDELSEDYSHDELGGAKGYPDARVQVTSAEEIAAVMSYANERKLPVVVRGSGTGLVGGSVAIHGGIMIDTTLMNHILELDTENLTVTVECGVLLMELAKFAEDNGFLYPPDPGEKSATIGGNISTNAGGMRAVKYGVTRDYVRGLTVVLSTGEIVELGGKIVKNSSGYSLKDLIIGSEGTLGIVAKAILKLVPLPKVTTSLLVPFESLDKGIESVPQIIKSGAQPTAIEFMTRETILFAEEYLGKRFPDTKSDSYILLTFDGADEVEVERSYRRVADLCLGMGATDAYIVDTEERKQSVWSARGAFLEAIKASTSEMDECDVVVPRSAVADFIKFSYELADRLNVRIPSFGHAGDGNLHIYICRDALTEDKWKTTLAAAFDALYTRAAEMNGLVSGEHGIGLAKREYMSRQYGGTLMSLMAGIKKAFDPNGILNPDKVI